MKKCLSLFARWSASFAMCLPLLARAEPAHQDNGVVAWQSEFSEALFKRAASENKLVLLDLEAIWCHWCHVMHKETYSDSKVTELIAKHFLPVRIDQDSRPDLSAYYNDYGWPATIILNAKGEDLVKESGFIEPDKFISILSEVVKNPVVHPDRKQDESGVVTGDGFLTDTDRAAYTTQYEQKLDRKVGGLNTPHHHLNSDVVEFGIRGALLGKKDYEDWAKLTLSSNRKLIDPVWGGVYQYSTHYGWDRPHYEKIIRTQATNLRMYSYGFSAWQEPSHVGVVNQIRDYLIKFMSSPEGGYYTSQDADVVRGEHSKSYFELDDAARRAIGIPKVDTNMYSYENGMLIEALCAAFAAFGDIQFLSDARKAAAWVEANRTLSGGGLRHGEVDVAGPYLRDNVTVGRGYLALYATTTERVWLEKAKQVADFILTSFRIEGSSGFYSFAPAKAGVLRPIRLIEENIPAVRFLNLLGRYSGDNKYLDAARQGMQWLSQPVGDVVRPGVLLAEAEVLTEPLHVTVVGSKVDASARTLYAAGLALPNTYKRIEWWDESEGRLPNHDVEYPKLDKAAVFLCTGKRCSFPIFAPEGLAKALKRK